MSKIEQFLSDSHFKKLSRANRETIEACAELYRLSQMDIRQLIDMSRDFEMWDEKNLASYLPQIAEEWSPKQKKQKLVSAVRAQWENLKEQPNSYAAFTPDSDFTPPRPGLLEGAQERTILGDCPVASSKTRCCNLKTLDSVISCGHDCSYCSIQSFYNEGKVLFDPLLKEKLAALELDPNKRYHIGTGQSSDSLMWGNRENNLEHMVAFARQNPNVILEFKSKSKNIEWLLEQELPRNILCTWSLNPQTIIDNEEHLTASLEERFTAARQLADKGVQVGFHFHPMVWYDGWQEEYGELFADLQTRFTPREVTTISFGTLTFIKPVIKKLRNRDFKTKILQMPLVDAEGKFSYPYEIKKELFSAAYDAFASWHKEVFFYMCMEDIQLWLDCFGYEYADNDAFEAAMLEAYFKKL